MTERNLREIVRECIADLRGVGDDAWHTLIDLGLPALPYLIGCFASTREIEKKAVILTVVSELRSADTLRFLLENLGSDHPPLWKAALDGLVTLGGDDVRNGLMQAIPQSSGSKQEWIREAIGQVETESTKGTDPEGT
jgi:hypothetical protein